MSDDKVQTAILRERVDYLETRHVLDKARLNHLETLLTKWADNPTTGNEWQLREWLEKR